jgi:hypothetical protein
LTRLQDFLNLNERAILPDAGKASREAAQAEASENTPCLNNPSPSANAVRGTKASFATHVSQGRHYVVFSLLALAAYCLSKARFPSLG